MHSPGNCCSRSTLRIMERDPLTYTAIPPPLPLGRLLLKILYPGRDISPSAIPLSSHVSVKARICKFGHCDIRIFNSSSFPRILRIFWWINNNNKDWLMNESKRKRKCVFTSIKRLSIYRNHERRFLLWLKNRDRDSSTMLYKPWSSFADQKLWLGYFASSCEMRAINYELPKTFHI